MRSVGATARAVAIGDATGDGRNDVVMTTTYDDGLTHDYRVWVFEQAADGTLSAPVSYPTSSTASPESIAIGDLTGDGRADVVVGLAAEGVQVFPQLLIGGLGQPTTTPSLNGQKIRLGRLDADADLDVAAIGWGTRTVTVFLNDGAGGLTSSVDYPADGGYGDLEIGDVSGDGRDDLVLTSGQSSAPDISVLRQLADGGFGPATEHRPAEFAVTQGIGIGDVTGDGRSDVVGSYSIWPSSFVAYFPQTRRAISAIPSASERTTFPNRSRSVI